MPTKIVIYKWMCDNCHQVFDVEADCALHERLCHVCIENGTVDGNRGPDKQSYALAEQDNLPTPSKFKLDRTSNQLELSTNNFDNEPIVTSDHQSPIVVNNCSESGMIRCEFKKARVTKRPSPLNDVLNRASPRFHTLVIRRPDGTTLVRRVVLKRQTLAPVTSTAPVVVKDKKKPSIGVYKCTQCSTTLNTLAQLTNHRRLTHQGGNPYFDCEQCSKKFTRKIYLNAHMKAVHVKERKFVCDICNKAYKCARGLSKHKVIHAAVRPYACTKCSKTLHTSGSELCHLRQVFHFFLTYT
jgi:predicted nucleic acid-binding Zn ribbon protein